MEAPSFPRPESGNPVTDCKAHRSTLKTFESLTSHPPFPCQQPRSTLRPGPCIPGAGILPAPGFAPAGTDPRLGSIPLKSAELGCPGPVRISLLVLRAIPGARGVGGGEGVFNQDPGAADVPALRGTAWLQLAKLHCQSPLIILCLGSTLTTSVSW